MSDESDFHESHLNDLLAVIHRDGGHYQEEHGTHKAVVDAIAVIHADRAAIEAAEREGFERARDQIATRAYAWGLDALTAEIRAMKPDGTK